MPVAGHGPYRSPSLGGSYGGYMGMAGNWARRRAAGPATSSPGHPPTAGQANANHTKYHVGIGTGVYWYMGGPGVDPHWNGTATEAAAGARSRRRGRSAAIKGKLHVTYPVLWADIEMPEIAPAPDNGWNAAYTSPCSGVVRAGHALPASIDRAEFNGFATYITGALQVQGGRLLGGVDLDVDLRHRHGFAASRTLTSGPTGPRPRTCRPRPTGWCLRTGT